jgi:WhiB family redox-sensing transcriptional regulator
MENTDWMRDTPCHDVGPSFFFPTDGNGSDAAITFCNTFCPAATKARCLQYAIAENIEHGIWGGQSERGLRSLQRAARARARSAA